jgi:hypothetical protein
MKLLSIERWLVVYDAKIEKRIDETPVNLPLEILQEIIQPKEDDKPLYSDYLLNIDQLNALCRHLGKNIQPDFDSFYYVLECIGNYDWNATDPKSID